MTKTATTVDGEPAVIDGTVPKQEPLVVPAIDEVIDRLSAALADYEELKAEHGELTKELTAAKKLVDECAHAVVRYQEESRQLGFNLRAGEIGENLRKAADAE